MIDWYRIKSALIDEPEIRKMSRILGIDRWGVVGRVQAFWGWCDIHANEGASGLCREDLDELCGCNGFADAMIEVGWLSVDDKDELSMTDWGKHNSPAAKERIRKTQEKRAQRARAKAQEQALLFDCLHESETVSPHAETFSPDRLPTVSPISKNKEQYNMGGSKATLYREPATETGSAQAAPAPISEEKDGFVEWLNAVKSAHPSASMSRSFAPDVMEAARGAYMRCPQAIDCVPLLKAYFADKLHEDKYGKAFWRSMGQTQFFDNLEDIISQHAERWNKETKWSRRRAGPAKPPLQSAQSAQKRAASAEVDNVPTEEERAAFAAELASLRAELEEGGDHAN